MQTPGSKTRPAQQRLHIAGPVAADAMHGLIMCSPQHSKGGQIEKQESSGFENAVKFMKRPVLIHLRMVEHIQAEDGIERRISMAQLHDGLPAYHLRQTTPGAAAQGRLMGVHATDAPVRVTLAQALHHAPGAAAGIQQLHRSASCMPLRQFIQHHVAQRAEPPVMIFHPVKREVFGGLHEKCQNGAGRVPEEASRRSHYAVDTECGQNILPAHPQ